MSRNSLDCVLEFIKIKEWSLQHFEMLAGLEAGLIQKAVDNNSDLSQESIQLIEKKFNADLNVAGYAILSKWGNKGEMVITRNTPQNVQSIREYYIKRLSDKADDINN